MLLSLLCCACSCLHFLHVAFYLLYSWCSDSLPYFLYFVFLACCTIFILQFLLFMSHLFHFFIFLSLLISFHVPLFSYSTFLCRTFFMLCSSMQLLLCLKSIHFGQFYIGALFLYFCSFDVTFILRGTFS